MDAPIPGTSHKETNIRPFGTGFFHCMFLRSVYVATHVSTWLLFLAEWWNVCFCSPFICRWTFELFPFLNSPNFKVLNLMWALDVDSLPLQNPRPHVNHLGWRPGVKLLTQQALAIILITRVAQMVESLPAVQENRFDSWVGKIPWRRKWHPTPVLLPGESHGQRSLAGYSPWGRKELATTEGLIFLSFLITMNHCSTCCLYN